MKTFLQLFFARNKEFYRDRGSLSWALVFPTLIIIGCAIAFSDDNENLLTLGYFPATAQPAGLATLDQPYSKWIAYDELATGQARLRHHQLHALVDSSSRVIWLNPNSSQGRLVMQLTADHPDYRQQLLDGQPIRYVDWVIPGVLGMNIMFGSLFGVGYVLVRYRKNGVLKRLQATPVSALQFLSAQVASRLFLVVATNALIFVGSDMFLDLVFVGHWWDLLLVAVLGAMSMISLALLIASRTDSEEFAGGILNATTWPMMFLSGIWFSLDDTPPAMQRLADFLPLTHLVKAGREIMINGAGLADVAVHLLVMLVMTLCCLALAAILFRWRN